MTLCKRAKTSTCFGLEMKKILEKYVCLKILEKLLGEFCRLRFEFSIAVSSCHVNTIDTTPYTGYSLARYNGNWIDRSV